MPPIFLNRRDAGRRLGAVVARGGYADPVVLGLPRGGVPVAFEVASALHAPLDVFIVRKLGAPMHEELAVGAIATGGIRVLNQSIIDELHVPGSVVDDLALAEQRELERRERAYRDSRPFPRVSGRTAIVVDDGVATGASMVAALQAVSVLSPAAIVAATPVISREARAYILRYADACDAVIEPVHLLGVGAWYDDFTQTSDDEVRALLREASQWDSDTEPAPPRAETTW